MRSIFALFFLGVAACSSDSFTQPAVDAAPDSLLPDDAGGDGAVADAADKAFCDQQPSGYLFCDDFDTLGDGATGLDPAWGQRSSGGGTAARVNTRYLSPHYALETTTPGGTSSGSLYRNPNVGLATKFSLAFAAYIEPGCVQSNSGVAMPAVAGIPQGQNGYFLAIAMSGPTVAFAEELGTPAADGGTTKSNANVLGTTPWPLGVWVRVLFEVDFAKKQGNLRLDGKLVESPAIKLAGTTGIAFPGVAMGTSTDASGTSACRITYDNVVFRINGQ